MSVSVRIAGLAATAALALGGSITVSAMADEAPAPAPCAQQEAQVEKAEEALARVTAVFTRQQDRVAKAKHAVEQAEAGRANAAARRALAEARHDVEKTKTTKRAQQMRLKMAQARLAECLAAQPTTTTTATAHG